MPDAVGLRARWIEPRKRSGLNAKNGGAAATYNNAQGTARSTSAGKLTVRRELRYLLGVMTAAEVYESVTNGGTTDFADVVAILNRTGSWCLIGGLGVNCYVEPVYTIDVDLVVVAKNLPQIQRELETADFGVERFEHRMNARRAGSKLNVQFTTDPRYQDYLGTETEREAGRPRSSGELGEYRSRKNLGRARRD